VTAKALKKPPPPPKKAFGKLAAALARSNEELVPAAFQFLFHPARYLVAYGGRDSCKSWSIARVLLVDGTREELRVLCCREIQASIKESVYRLLCDQIHLLGLDDFYHVGADRIEGKNGTAFFFEGLRFNEQKIKSYEGINRVWVEEGQSVSDRSWEILIPTIARVRGHRFYISFNPLTQTDPVAARFVESHRADVVAKKVSWRDNPHFTAEARAEKDWLAKVDPDAYQHVWEGAPRTASDAQILKGKFVAEAFDVDPRWSGPYHGADYGFARDPSAALRCYIDDGTRTLYVTHEGWWLGADIDALPGLMEAAVPGIGRHVVYCDSARPETTSYLARNGIPRAVSVEKWAGSVDDGVAFLRSFSRIVIDPACRHLIDECARYSFKTDRLTGAVLPEVEDKHNHLIDALRYALSPLIRNLPTGGFVDRAALLVRGEPVAEVKVDQGDGQLIPGLPMRVFVTVAACDRPGTGVGAVTWAHSPGHGWPLLLLDWELVEIDEALNGPAWLGRLIDRAQALRAEWNAVERATVFYAEQGPLFDALARPFTQYIEENALGAMFGGARPPYDLVTVEPDRMLRSTLGAPLLTLDDRMTELRATVNGAQFVKFAASAYGKQATHRSNVTNHLVNQIVGYRPGVRDAATELVNAFAIGALLALDRK
jgi:phage terminase large subunit